MSKTTLPNYLKSILLILLGCQTSLWLTGCALKESRKTESNQTITVSTNFDSEKLAKQLADAYFNRQPVDNFNYDLTLEEGQEIQIKFVNLLSEKLGKIVGYKVGLTSQKAQERFKVNTPLSGFLLEKMLLESGAEINADFGAISMLEGDLMVRVGSDKINTATTPAEIVKHLDAVIPFLELPDLIYSPNIPLNAGKLQAINVGARLGIKGEIIPINGQDDWEKRLNNIQLKLLDHNNNQIAIGDSKALLGNPLEVILWLKNNLHSQGIKLQPGDLISLGTITPLIPVSSGQKIKAQYLGLKDQEIVEISVTFK